MTPPLAIVTVVGVPALEGRAAYLVGDAATARIMTAQGKTIIGPELWAALAMVAEVFPGARVEELRR